MASRTQAQIRKAVHALGYIARCEERGEDVSRLAEKREKSTAFLIRQKVCLHCGTPLTREDSIEDWKRDGLGPVCRANLGAAAPRYRMTPDESPESMRDDLFDRESA